MEKRLEDYLWDNIYTVSDGSDPFRRSPRDVINDMVKMGMINSPKQAHRTLEKWCSKGIYNYGCCLDLGWKDI